MNKFLILMLTLFNISTYTNKQIDTCTELGIQEEIIKKDEPYTLNFHIEKLKKNIYNLIIKMELEKDAHYVSPNSKGTYSGIFAMILEKNTKLRMREKFSENPLSKESIDPWSGNPVSFVKNKSYY